MASLTKMMELTRQHFNMTGSVMMRELQVMRTEPLTAVLMEKELFLIGNFLMMNNSYLLSGQLNRNSSLATV